MKKGTKIRITNPDQNTTGRYKIGDKAEYTGEEINFISKNGTTWYLYPNEYEVIGEFILDEIVEEMSKNKNTSSFIISKNGSCWFVHSPCNDIERVFHYPKEALDWLKEQNKPKTILLEGYYTKEILKNILDGFDSIEKSEECNL